MQLLLICFKFMGVLVYKLQEIYISSNVVPILNFTNLYNRMESSHSDHTWIDASQSSTINFSVGSLWTSFLLVKAIFPLLWEKIIIKDMAHLLCISIFSKSILVSNSHWVNRTWSQIQFTHWFIKNNFNPRWERQAT